jgi:hypothetical protein
MPVKSPLRVVLMAGETVVAESEDAVLWQDVLARLYRSDAGAAPALTSNGPTPRATPESARESPHDPLSMFATELGVQVAQLEGACRPRGDEPYVTIDHHTWEAYKRGTPPRGPRAVGAAAIVGTLLALWARRAGSFDATLPHVTKALASLGTRDSAPRRTVMNCRWLQYDAGRVRLNPARISDAISVARAFVTAEWSDYMDRGAPR